MSAWLTAHSDFFAGAAFGSLLLTVAGIVIHCGRRSKPEGGTVTTTTTASIKAPDLTSAIRRVIEHQLEGRNTGEKALLRAIAGLKANSEKKLEIWGKRPSRGGKVVSVWRIYRHVDGEYRAKWGAGGADGIIGSSGLGGFTTFYAPNPVYAKTRDEFIARMVRIVGDQFVRVLT